MILSPFSFEFDTILLVSIAMEAYAPLQVLKKRAKGDLNKQRRIKNLAKNKEFVERHEAGGVTHVPGRKHILL